MKYLLVLLLLAMTSCTNNIQSQIKTLKLTQQGVLITAKTADTLCTQGVLEHEQCVACAKLYKKSQVLYSVALETELLYIDAQLSGSNVIGLSSRREHAIRKLLDLAEDMQDITSSVDFIEGEE